MSVYVHEELTEADMRALSTPVRFDLIDAEIDWAERESAKGHMSAWNQEEWATDNAPCGTAYCIAGHVASQIGDIHFSPDVFGAGSFVMTADNVIRAVFDVAADALGIRPYLEEWYDGFYEMPGGPRLCADLFSPDNTLADLKLVRDNYAALEGVPTKYNH